MLFKQKHSQARVEVGRADHNQGTRWDEVEVWIRRDRVGVAIMEVLSLRLYIELPALFERTV